MKTRTVTVNEGEWLGPVDFAYDFYQHGIHPDFVGMGIQVLREISEGDPSEWKVLDGDYWRDVYCVGMYDGWPFWKPTPAVLRSGVLGPEVTFFYNLRKSERKAQ